MEATTILYALSTMAQTCAALAAFVGALGLYRLQSIRTRQAEVERHMRQLLAVTYGGSAHALPMHDLVDRRAPAYAEEVTSEAERARMTAYLGEWRRFDPDYRRASRLLGFFIAWNLVAIGASLAGFAFLYRLTGSPVAVLGLWVLTLGTVLSTAIMLIEVRGSFREWFGTVRWLEDA